MNYLIMGGAGFIGSNLSEYLKKSSALNEVIVVDNMTTGNKNNLLDFGFNPERIIEMDVTTDNFITKFYESVNRQWTPDVIINLACPASPIHYQKHPFQTLTTNFLGTYNGLFLAGNSKARFFQASTSEIYGDPLQHPQTESYLGNVNTWGPRACYDEGKRVAESLCYEAYSQKGIDVRVARIFNTYGPRMAIDDGRVVSNFIVQALRGEDLTIYGNGNQTRSLCYIDDMLKGILAVCAYGQSPVNLGNPQEITIMELAEKVLTLTKSSSKIIRLPIPKDDPVRRKPDINKAKSLGWHPKVSLDDGLQRTIEYFRSKLDD